MHLRRSTTIGLLSGLLISGACTAYQDTRAESETQPKQQQTSSTQQEMVQVKIRMPDGRVIIRMEPKSPSRVDPDRVILDGERPPVLTKSGTRSTGGKVNTTKGDVTGGSNGASGAITKAGSGGGGGGGGGVRGSHSGGGVGGGDTPAHDDDRGGGNLGGDNGDNPNALLLDEDKTVHIYAWRNSGEPFQHVTNNYVLYPVNRTPQQLAALTAERVRNDQPDRIVLRFFYEMDPATRPPFDLSDPLDMISRGGYTEGLIEYWRTFATELKDLGVEPDFLVMDYETGIVLDRLPTEEREGFINSLIHSTGNLDPDFPVSIRSLTYEQFMNYRAEPGRSAQNEYLKFAVKFRAKFLKKVFSDTFDDVYGRHIPISNYSEVNSSFPLIEFNSRPIPDVTMAGVSSPISYLYERPDWGRYYRTTKNVRWNRLIDVLNRNRSAAATGPVVPWIAAPGFGIRIGTWASTPAELESEMRIWRIMMDHLLATGIDNYILWNPIERYNPMAVESDALVDQWLAQHPYAPRQLDSALPEIPLDVDFIETNGVVTTYEQFMQALNGE